MTCERCGWQGVPIYWHGQRVGCPVCERSPDFDAEVQRAMGNYRVAIRSRRRLTTTELRTTSRNAACPCGSGLKFKRCHGNGRAARSVG